MLYHNVLVMARYQRLVDASVVSLTAAGVWMAGARGGLWSEETTREPLIFFATGLGLSFAWLAGKFQIYHARRTEQLRPELVALLEILLFATGMSCLLAQTMTRGLPPGAYGASLLLAALLLVGMHGTMRLVVRYLRRTGDDYRVWLLVGRNERSAKIAEDVLANPHFGVRIVEVVDIRAADGRAPDHAEPFAAAPLSSLPQREIASAEDVREILENQIIDEVVVTLPVRSHYDEIQTIMALCGAAGISVKFSTEVFDQTGTKIQMAVGPLGMVTLFSGPSDHAQLVFKRTIDVASAAVALVVLSPVLAAIALWIRMRSHGPALFFQTRVGLHGRLFRMVKFRTMIQGAAELQSSLGTLNQRDEIAFKIEDDPRIAPGCRFLRKYHLDELPQLWNVMVGDMSLVGPRALPPMEAPGREWWQRRRLSMPPGMTCFWQAEGNQRISFQRWMELDLAYIDQWSIWLDLRLIFRTLLMLPRGSGW